MSIFRKFRTLPVPEECRDMEVRIESSACTGEKTIGFYDPSARRLIYAELVRSDEDIQSFYDKYGMKRDK